MRLSLVVVAACAALPACDGYEENGTYVTHLEGSPDAVRAAGFLSPSEFVAIGGDSAFGLARLHTARTDPNDESGLQTRTWTPVDEIAPFDADAVIVGTFAMSETQLFSRENGAWITYSVPFGATANTAFVATDRTVYALELMPDGAGAVLAWTLGENRWQEVPSTRPIGNDARGFHVTSTGALVWAASSLGVISVSEGIRTTIADCADDRFGACTMPIDVLGVSNETVLVATCPAASYAITDGEIVEIPLPAGTARCGAPRTGNSVTNAIATFSPEDEAGGVYEYDGTGWVLLDDAEPRMNYTTNVDGAYLGFVLNPTADEPRGIDCIQFF